MFNAQVRSLDDITVRVQPAGRDDYGVSPSSSVSSAVGGDASAWSVEISPIYKHGPAFERLRDFNVVVWYTGGSYGGRDDNVAVLSVEDEKTVRRYLQEAGGSFILVSPGYVSNLAYGATWTSSARPFLKEVAGIDGFAALVQRFAAGTVLGRAGMPQRLSARRLRRPKSVPSPIDVGTILGTN